MELYLLKYYIVSIIVLSILYFIGDFFRYTLKINLKNQYEIIFFNLFVGLVIFITIIGIYFTKGKTIFLGNIVLILIGLIYYIKQPSNYIIKSFEESFIRFNIKFIVEFALLLFFYYLFIFIYAEDLGGVPFWKDSDNISYSRNIYYLILSGHETAIYDFFDLSNKPILIFIFFYLD